MVLGTGSALLYYNWISGPVALVISTALMALAAVWSEHYAPVVQGRAVSIALPMAVAALALGGPVHGTFVATASAVRPSVLLSSARDRMVAAFNLGQLATTMGLSGAVYMLSGGKVLGETGTFVAADFPEALLPIGITSLVVAVSNLCLAAIGVTALYGGSIIESVRASLAHTGSFTALGVVGFLIAQVVASNVFALPLFLFPLMLARQIYQRYAALKDIYVDTVRSLINALEAKDPYTRGHSERVAGLAVDLAKKLGMSERDQDVLEKAALLHDVGKLALASSLLAKPSRLSEEEFEAMRRHPDLGADMVSRIPPLRALVVPIRQHHEWYDGSGYPLGLDAGRIDRLARILAIADAYDAMTTDRAYRAALDTHSALNELRQGGGKQFDPGLVPVFVQMVLEKADTAAPTPRPSAAVAPYASSEVASA